jgi:hypothetical protein
MHQRTDLSVGNINDTDRLIIELIEPLDAPPIVAINWPSKPTVCTPGDYDQTAATAMRVLANATVRLAQIRRGRKL